MSRAAFSGFSPLDDYEEFKLASKRTRVPYPDIVSSLVNKYLSHRVNWTTLEVACLAFAFQSPWKFVAGDKDIEIEWAMEKGATRLSEAIEKVYPPGITHPLYIEHRKVLDHFEHSTDAVHDIDRNAAIAYLLEKGVRRDRFSEEILREFDTWKAKAWGAESLSESGERAHPALQSNFETNAAPRIEAKKRTLSPLCQDILLVHLRESTSEYSMLPLDVGRGKVGLLDALERFGRSPDLDSVKRGNKELRGRGLICTKSGPRGGAYLTEAGRAEAEKIRAAR